MAHSLIINGLATLLKPKQKNNILRPRGAGYAPHIQYMREYDVTPEQQGTDCRYQSECQYYQYGIWCNCCNQYESIDDAFFDED